MGRNTSRKTKARPLPPPVPTGWDATPERLLKEPAAQVEETFRIPGQEGLQKARRFRRPHLDRWHTAGMIDQRQWAAGEVYRSTYERCHLRLAVVASYGERTGAGEHPGNFGYGLPRLVVQAEARSALHAMRDQWPLSARGTMDRFLLRDEMPRFSGRRHASLLAEIRYGLDVLDQYLRNGR